jgi:hypothetical protein
MSNVIRFLETAGRKPLSPAEYAASVAALDVAADQKKALLDGNQHALNELLDGRKQLRCAIFASEED